MVPSSSTGRRAAALLVLAVLTGALVAVALHQRGGGSSHRGDTALRPGAAAGEGVDPLRYDPRDRAAYEARAAQGLAHVLYAKSPGGVLATARRVAAFRPLVEAAARKGDVDPDTLEGIVFLESGGRPDAQAGNDLNGAAGLTQILAETGQDLLGMRVDVAKSTRLTRGIRRGTKVAAREAERRRVDERFDPAKALAGTVKYLDFAKGKLDGRDDMAVVGYHMGVGNLQTVLKEFGASDTTPYVQVFFGASPLNKPAAYAKLASLGDDSSTYLWRVHAAEDIMRRYRAGPAALAARALLETNKNSAEEVLHPGATSVRYHDPAALKAARDAGILKPLSARQLLGWHVRLDPQMGELAPKLGASRTSYRELRPEALAVLRYLGVGVQAISGATRPLDLTSSARDDTYQRLLTARNIEATRAYSLHTTGFTFDVLRTYASPQQALAFQFLLDRLTALNLIAWVREPAAIHITVAGDAGRLLR